MAERAHPDLPGFQDKWHFSWRRRLIPWISKQPSPYREAFTWRYRWASKHCQGKDVLDIPCGMGWGTSLLKGCRTLTGIDIAPDAIAEANKRYGKKAKFLVGSMEALEFENNSFDVVVCLEGIEHVSSNVGQTFISEANRILRFKGKLLLSSPHCSTCEHSGNPHHVREYRPEELRVLIGSHFRVTKIITQYVDNLTVSYVLAECL